MADFSLLQQPGFAAAALGGYQAGAAIGKERRTQEALSGVDLARPETIMPVLSADPQMGSALLTASTAMAKAQREGEARSAMGDYIISRLSGKGGAANTSSAPAISITAGGMPDSQPGDIVVTAPTQQETPEQRLAKADPEGFMKLQEQFGKFDDNQREALKEQQDAIASVAQQARSMPLAQRGAFIQSQAGFLQGHHVDPATIANFDPSDANIDAVVAQSLGVKGMLERGDKDRTYNLQREKFTHDVAHDDATLAVSRGNLAVSQGNLALSRQREGRVAIGKGGSGGGSGASGMPAPTNRAAYDALPAGTRYRAPDGSVRTK